MLREANLEGRSLIEAIIHGFILALGLILPLGAQNIFIFNQGANYNGLKSVAPVIIAAGCCDTFLILLAVLGVSLIFYSLPMLQVIIYVIGLVFLLYMAWTLWNEQVGKVSQQSALSVKKQITFAMSVSLLNPHAVMDTVGVIGPMQHCIMVRIRWHLLLLLYWFHGYGLSCLQYWEKLYIT